MSVGPTRVDMGMPERMEPAWFHRCDTVGVCEPVWGSQGRPAWIRNGRTYPFINAASDEMVQLIEARQARIEDEDAAARAAN